MKIVKFKIKNFGASQKLWALIFISALFVMPNSVLALEMPQSMSDIANLSGQNARSYVVADAKSGAVLIAKNPDLPWPPASLTKLVTTLVVLDTKPKLYKSISITAADQAAGSCNRGGACIYAKPGVKFTVDGLFHAALMPSANNAANALARSTGLSQSQFVARMNKKVQSLGATNTHFNEPTGMDPGNQTTAADFSKIVVAAFANSYLRQIAGLQNYTLRSTSHSRYNQVIKNTDKLLGDNDVKMLGAKTGYLDEAHYNLASLLRYRDGQQLAVVVLGEEHLYSAFQETKDLANLAEQAQGLSLQNANGTVLGANSQSPTLNP